MIIAAQAFRPLRDLHRRAFAWFMDRAGPAYEREVAERKRALLGDLHGRVVEIGAGTGPNLRYLPVDAEVVAVDPNPHMESYFRDEAERLGRAVEFRRGYAQEMDFPDGSVDAVVSTLVLCSVDRPDEALAEIRRVLRPGGRFVFVEHVGAEPGSWLRRLQRWIRPLWKAIGDGCRPDRDTAGRIRDAGFREVEIEAFRLPFPVVSPHIAGVARR